MRYRLAIFDFDGTGRTRFPFLVEGFNQLAHQHGYKEIDPILFDMSNTLRAPITVVDYDPSWPSTFETLKSGVLQALGSLAASVEHVGSTSVPGLAAKPIIDMDVVVASAADVSTAIDRLSALGYVHRGNLGIKGREAFYSPSGLPPHHLYVCVQDAIALINHLTIRNHLRKNSAAARTYSMLKKQLAETFPTDMDRYIHGKTDFLEGILRESGFPEDVLAAISNANRMKP